MKASEWVSDGAVRSPRTGKHGAVGSCRSLRGSLRLHCRPASVPLGQGGRHTLHGRLCGSNSLSQMWSWSRRSTSQKKVQEVCRVFSGLGTWLEHWGRGQVCCAHTVPDHRSCTCLSPPTSLLPWLCPPSSSLLLLLSLCPFLPHALLLLSVSLFPFPLPAVPLHTALGDCELPG